MGGQARPTLGQDLIRLGKAAAFLSPLAATLWYVTRTFPTREDMQTKLLEAQQLSAAQTTNQIREMIDTKNAALLQTFERLSDRVDDLVVAVTVLQVGHGRSSAPSSSPASPPSSP